MSQANATTLSALYKKRWKQLAEEMLFEGSPGYAMIPKVTDWSGETLEVPIVYGAGGGASSNYGKARANKAESKVTKMSISTNDEFVAWSVDNKSIRLARNDAGAVRRLLDHEFKMKTHKFKRRNSWKVWGNGGGSVGLLSATQSTSSTTLTFRTAQSLRRVDVGDRIVFAADSGDPTASPAGLLQIASIGITGVDDENNQVTVDATLASIGITSTHVSNGLYVFIDGDYANSIYGIPSYVPYTAPSSSIWGMARSANKRRLGGVRTTGNKNLQIDEVTKKLLRTIRDAGGSTSHIFMSTANFEELDLTLGSQKRYADEKVGKVGFVGIEFVHGSHTVKVFEDADIEDAYIFALKLDTWKLHSALDYPGMLTERPGGSMYTDEEGSNSIEGKIGGYAQTYTDMPGSNGVADRTAA